MSPWLWLCRGSPGGPRLCRWVRRRRRLRRGVALQSQQRRFCRRSVLRPPSGHLGLLHRARGLQLRRVVHPRGRPGLARRGLYSLRLQRSRRHRLPRRRPLRLRLLSRLHLCRWMRRRRRLPPRLCLRPGRDLPGPSAMHAELRRRRRVHRPGDPLRRCVRSLRALRGGRAGSLELPAAPDVELDAPRCAAASRHGL